MIKDPMLVLTEAMDLDITQTDMSDEPLVKELEEIDEISESVIYTEEMIPVFETSSGYVVEYDLLQKLIESKVLSGEYCDELKALRLLEDCNAVNKINVLIESELSIKSNLDNLKKRLKSEKNPRTKSIIKKRIDDTTNKLKTLKDRVVKKK